MTDEAPKKRRGRPAKKKVEQELAPAFLQEEKKIGRPKGAENKTRPTIVLEKDPCPHCGKTSLKIVKVNPSILVCHRSQGKTYNALTRKLCKCSGCNKHTTLSVFDIV